MAVQINWKICDNDKACSGIAECPTGALYWNEEKNTIDIKNELCISCRKCITNGCPVGAIIVTETDAEYERAKANIESDSHDKAQLFVDRFGAAPIRDDVLIDKENIAEKTTSGITLIERFTDSSIQCLIHSIKVDDVRFKLGLTFNYYTCEDDEPDETTEYPILDVYLDGKLIGSLSGYYSEDRFDEFVTKLQSIIGN